MGDGTGCRGGACGKHVVEEAAGADRPTSSAVSTSVTVQPKRTKMLERTFRFVTASSAISTETLRGRSSATPATELASVTSTTPGGCSPSSTSPDAEASCGTAVAVGVASTREATTTVVPPLDLF
eukprot:7384275-Prymnesium_polylepis.4